MNDSPQKIFNDFLLHLSTQFPAYNVTGLLIHLQINGVIKAGEAAVIQHAIEPTEKAMILFQQIMPTKDHYLQMRLIEVLRTNDMTSLADFLEACLVAIAPNPNPIPAPPVMATAAAARGAGTGQQLVLVDNDERSRVYNELCRELGAEFPVETLAAELRLVGAITLGQLEAVKKENSTADKISKLFQQYMATIQNIRSHEDLIRALKTHGYTDTASYLKSNLFK